jgi:hypothetical protein
MDPEDIDEMAETQQAKFEKLVNDAYKAGHAASLFDENIRAKARAFRAGVNGDAKDFKLESALLNTGGEFKFGRLYEPGDHDPTDLRNAYNEDGDIEVARQAHGLPGNLLDENFGSKVSAGIDKVRRDFAGDNGDSPAVQSRLERQLRGLLKARQLHRRYNEGAIKRAEAAVADEANVQEERVLVVGVPQEQAEQYAQRGAVPLNPERGAIASTEMPVADVQEIVRRAMEQAARDQGN